MRANVFRAIFVGIFFTSIQFGWKLYIADFKQFIGCLTSGAVFTVLWFFWNVIAGRFNFFAQKPSGTAGNS